jgi:sortase A
MWAGDPCQHCASRNFLGKECTWPRRNCGAPTVRWPARGRIWARRLLVLVTAAMIATGLWHLGQAGYIQAKAVLAQVLIKQAWADTRDGAGRARPWPWADTWPVARLKAPAQQADLYVLAGADDRTLAFGPGHVYGTPLPGEAGNSVMGAHRDTHFAFLQWLENGDELEVETPARNTLRYRVSHTAVVDKDDLGVLAQPPAGRQITLVTCYPFDAVRAGGRLRYVVIAVAVDAPPAPALAHFTPL